MHQMSKQWLCVCTERPIVILVRAEALTGKIVVMRMLIGTASS